MFPNTNSLRALVRSALQEDSARSDITTRLLIHPAWRVHAAITANHAGVIAGLPLVRQVFRAFDPSIYFRPLARDGDHVQARQVLAVMKGKARSVLSAERPALNALQHLSGIATFTHAQVELLKGSSATLFDTRKTLPGWRALQKYAVRCGGAKNHRMSLGEAMMIKENHLEVVRLAGRDWASRIKRWHRRHPHTLVQVEIQTQRDLHDALQIKAHRVLLDNLSPRVMKRMIRLLRKQVPGIEIEITGGVRPENLRQLGRLGADRISMGCLTHSVKAFDCSLHITRVDS